MKTLIIILFLMIPLRVFSQVQPEVDAVATANANVAIAVSTQNAKSVTINTGAVSYAATPSFIMANYTPVAPQFTQLPYPTALPTVVPQFTPVPQFTQVFPYPTYMISPNYSLTASASTSATGYAVSITNSAYLFNKASLAVSTIGGTGAVTFAWYESQWPGIAAWVSCGGVSITGAAANYQIFVPTPAFGYAVSVLGTAASTTIKSNLTGAQ